MNCLLYTATISSVANARHAILCEEAVKWKSEGMTISKTDPYTNKLQQPGHGLNSMTKGCSPYLNM
jgi:hypothetical protein